MILSCCLFIRVFSCLLLFFLDQVSAGFLRLYINGELVEEKTLASSGTQDSNSTVLRKIDLIGSDNSETALSCYLYSPKVLPSTSSMKDQYKVPLLSRICCSSLQRSKLDLMVQLSTWLYLFDSRFPQYI